MALLIRDVTLIEDDVYILHPPGYLESTNLHSESVQDDDSILLTTQDVAFHTPLTVVSAASDDQLATYTLDDLTFTEADITLLDAREKATDCVLEEDTFSALYSPDKIYVIDSIEPSDSFTSLDITEQYFRRMEDPCQEATSLATPPPSEEQELDVTQREETLKPSNICMRSLSINNQDTISPRVPDGTPIFSRYTIDDKVIFPIRKPPSQRDSTSFSEDIKSAFKKVVATWAKTRDELNVDHSHSSNLPKLSTIGDFSLFKVEEEIKPTVPGHDPYDSWPFIRNRIQEDVVLEDENIFQSALGYNKLA